MVLKFEKSKMKGLHLMRAFLLVGTLLSPKMVPDIIW